jgi:hypothetical protein
MISIQSTIDLRFLQIRQTHLVWHFYDGIPDIFNKLDSLRDTQAKDARRGQRDPRYFHTIKSASTQWPFAERPRSPATTRGAIHAGSGSDQTWSVTRVVVRCIALFGIIYRCIWVETKT